MSFSMSMPYSLAFERIVLAPDWSETSEPLAVAHEGRLDVLVRDRVPPHRAHVYAPFVGEGRVSHVGPVLVGYEVRHLVDEDATAPAVSTASPGLCPSQPIFRTRSGMMEQRFALPQRSP